MAKNNHTQPNQYAQREEQIRKAKGNPNKNLHKGKKNSNYHGTAAAANLEKPSHRARIQLTREQKILLGVDLALLLVVLVLRLTAYQNSLLLSNASTLLLGATCIFLFYIRRNSSADKNGFYKVIQGLLVLIGVVYCVIGVMGFLMMCGVTLK